LTDKKKLRGVYNKKIQPEVSLCQKDIKYKKSILGRADKGLKVCSVNCGETIIRLLVAESVHSPAIRTIPGNSVAGQAGDGFIHAGLADGKPAPAGPAE